MKTNEKQDGVPESFHISFAGIFDSLLFRVKSKSQIKCNSSVIGQDFQSFFSYYLIFILLSGNQNHSIECSEDRRNANFEFVSHVMLNDYSRSPIPIGI